MTSGKYQDPRGDIAKDTAVVTKIISWENHYDQLYGKKFEHLGEIPKSWKHKLKKWTQEKAENLNILITVKCSYQN